MRKLAQRFGQGFTLIELMIVVAIIGILAAIAIPNFIKFQCRSKQSEAKSQLKSMYVAQESYFAEHDVYVGITNAEANGGNLTGWAPKGAKIRYSYDATANGTGTNATLLEGATAPNANGADGLEMNGDAFTLDQTLTIAHPINGCS